MIGTTPSHYRVLEKIGEGGMGVVYKAEDTSLGRQVAIKVLPEAFAADPERMARFEREAKLLASLSHQDIVAMYSLEETDGKRADIWAFGCILFECLSGKRSFAGGSVSETVAKILETEPVWDSLPKSLPTTVLLLLRRCLQKDRSARLHDMADARIEIDEALKSPSEAVQLRA